MAKNTVKTERKSPEGFTEKEIKRYIRLERTYQRKSREEIKSLQKCIKVSKKAEREWVKRLKSCK